MQGEIADRVGHGHDLVDADAPAVAAAAAARAAGCLVAGDVVVDHEARPRRGSASRVTAVLHPGHRTRARRCAITQRTEDETRNGSMPISTRRVMELGASLVCSVERRR